MTIKRQSKSLKPPLPYDNSFFSHMTFKWWKVTQFWSAGGIMRVVHCPISSLALFTQYQFYWWTNHTCVQIFHNCVLIFHWSNGVLSLCKVGSQWSFKAEIMSVDNNYSVIGFPKEHDPLINSSAFEDDHLVNRHQERRQTSSFSCCSLVSVATILFSTVVVTGQVTQYASLPLWIDSTTSTQNQTAKWKPTVDGYFVVSFASLSFVIVFGFVLLCSDFICPNYLVKTEWSNRRLMLLVGSFQGVSAMFIVFSSSGNRTPPYLQAILGNFSIPVTLILR